MMPYDDGSTSLPVRYHGKLLDLSLPLRYSGVPNNGKLELVTAAQQRTECELVDGWTSLEVHFLCPLQVEM